MEPLRHGACGRHGRATTRRWGLVVHAFGSRAAAVGSACRCAACGCDTRTDSHTPFAQSGKALADKCGQDQLRASIRAVVFAVGGEIPAQFCGPVRASERTRLTLL